RSAGKTTNSFLSPQNVKSESRRVSEQPPRNLKSRRGQGTAQGAVRSASRGSAGIISPFHRLLSGDDCFAVVGIPPALPRVPVARNRLDNLAILRFGKRLHVFG